MPLLWYARSMISLGIIATILSIIGGLPYIYNAYRKKTKPHRVAWLIFLILSILAWLTQYDLGARESLIFYTWFVINNVILLGLSLRKNAGYGDVTLVNIASFVLAMLAIVIWKATDSALLALICVLVADGIGALLILIKAFKHPNTETMSMWLVGSVATFLNILATNTADASILAAPVQVFLFNLGIVAAILLGRKSHRLKTKS